MRRQDTIGRQETGKKARDAPKAKGLARLAGSLVSYWNRHTVLCLFVIVLLVYNLNARSIPSGDTVPASLLPFSLLEFHSINFDHFVQYYSDHGIVTYFMGGHKGQIVSGYPIVTGLLITPIYVIPYLLIKLAGIPVDLNNSAFFALVDVMEKVSASIVAALACCVLYLALRRMFSKNVAVAAALIFALCTSMWTIGALALWQHGVSSLLFCALLYLVFSHEKKPNDMNLVCMGIISGLYFFNRPSDSLMLIPVILYPLLKGARSVILYAVPAAVISLPFAAYNYYFFESPLGSYSTVTSMFDPRIMVAGFASLLISPSRGLLIYTPVVLLAIPGFLKIKTIENAITRKFMYACAVGVVLEILLYSSFSQWHGGYTYGPRFLTVLQPALAVYIALFLSGLSIAKSQMTRKNMTVIVAIVLLILVSFTVQLIGATCYAQGGYTWDTHATTFGDYWNFSNTQIGDCISAGPGKFMYYQTIGKFIQGFL